MSCSDAQHADIIAPTAGAPWLSSANIVSVAPTPSLTDDSALRRTLVAQHIEAEECNQPTVVGSSQTTSPASEHDIWSDFIFPEHLLTSEAIRSCDFPDFPSFLTPQTSFPETLSSASPDLQPLSPLAIEDIAASNRLDVVEPHQFEIVDTFGPEAGSTESALSVQPSDGWVFDPGLTA